MSLIPEFYDFIMQIESNIIRFNKEIEFLNRKIENPQTPSHAAEYSIEHSTETEWFSYTQLRSALLTQMNIAETCLQEQKAPPEAKTYTELCAIISNDDSIPIPATNIIIVDRETR